MNNFEAILVNADAGRIPLPDGVVHCVTTSPPYWSLRQYHGEQGRAWSEVIYSPMPGPSPLAIPAMTCPLGLEPDPESFVAHLVLCFREVYRVLREDGVCWIVVGDSFNSSTQFNHHSNGLGDADRYAEGHSRGDWPGHRSINKNLHPGNLLGIPYRLMLALQADGWICRNDVMWAKKSPMPESVSGTRYERHRVKISPQRKGNDSKYGALGHRDVPNFRPGYTELNQAKYADCPGCPTCLPNDGYVLRRGSWRHTRSHETVLMLVKSMGYWADQERIREAIKPESLQRYEYGLHSSYADSSQYGGIQSHGMCETERMGDYMNPAGRNPRDVLSPSPESYPGQHYAVYPRGLISPLIQATCPIRCCPVCGAGHAPIIDRQSHTMPISERNGRVGHNGQPPQQSGWFWTEPEVNVLGYRPTCAHAAEPIPGLLLDPFIGSGTTALVARELGLRCIGLDLSGAYLRDQAGVHVLDKTPEGALAGLPLFTGIR